jgi:hypothetical protein
VWIAYLYKTHHYDRSLYTAEYLNCYFKGSSAAQKMPDQGHPDTYRMYFSWLTGVNILLGTLVVTHRQKRWSFWLFIGEMLLNFVCQLVYSIHSSTSEDKDMTYLRFVSIVSIVFQVICAAGLCWACILWGNDKALEGPDGHIDNMLSNCLVKLHLRISLLFGYVSMVYWIVYFYGSDYCSEISPSLTTFFLVALAVILVIAALVVDELRNRAIEGDIDGVDWNVEAQRADWKSKAGRSLDKFFKITYLTFGMVTYNFIFEELVYKMYNAKPEHYVSVLNTSDEGQQRINDFSCSTMCADFMNLAKTAWISALLLSATVYYLIASLVDFPGGQTFEESRFWRIWEFIISIWD